MNPKIIEGNKKVAQGWEEEKFVKLQRRVFYFLILPAYFYFLVHLFLFLAIFYPLLFSDLLLLSFGIITGMLISKPIIW